MGIIGILLYTLWKSKPYFFDKTKVWSFPIFVSENVRSWIWSFVIVLVATLVTSFTPDKEVLAVLLNFTGINLTVTPAGFLTLGLLANVTVK